MAISVTDECVRHELTVFCNTCRGGWRYTVYERHGYDVQPCRSTSADHEEYRARVGASCSCGGTYQAGERESTWSVTFFVCPTCGKDAEEQYAAGAYAGRYCDTPGCPDSWDAAGFIDKDRVRVDWLNNDDGDDWGE